MDESRMALLADLFDRALAVPHHERSELVRELAGGDAELQEELTSLLAAHASSNDFFDELSADVVGPAYSAVLENGAGGWGAALASELEAALTGTYRIEKELGGGGMSRVFLAEEIKLSRQVVIKVLPAATAASMSGERFRREIQLAAQLQHPHIVPLLASDSSERLLYYTMPYVAGESLRGRIAREGALPVRDAMKIWRDVLDALAYAHARGVVHRDIKPANILLSGRNALVADFGIARAIEVAAEDAEASAAGMAIGTPAYMAPEQVTSAPAMDHRVDIYAAGLVMYEMLEGRLPFTGRSARDVLLARLTEDAPRMRRPDCPDRLAAMVMRCLASDPAVRPESADALLNELEAVEGAQQTLSTKASGEVLRVGAPARLDDATRQPKGLVRLVYSLAAVTVIAAVFVLTRGGESVSPSLSAPSVAVLPLEADSTEAEDVALANGLTEELIVVLGRMGKLRVVSSTSVDALRARQLTVRQIAESLRVSHVLEGSLRKIGSRIRMQIRLVTPIDGSTSWSETYDRELGDIFIVQEDISRAVASELNVRLIPNGQSASSGGYKPNIKAYEWYLRGRNTTHLRSAVGLMQGIEYFKRAIEADSGFAAAWAHLTWLYLNVGGRVPGKSHQLRDSAARAAEKSVQLDSTLAEAHAALGWSRIVTRNWSVAEAELNRAVAMDPRVHRGYEGLARLYMLTGRPAEQLAAARRGFDADPYSYQAIRELALALNMNHRCDETLELLRPLKELIPPAGVAGVIRGLCYIRKEMWTEAIAEFRWTMEHSDASMALAFLGYSLARGGQRGEALELLRDLLAGRKDSRGAFGITVVYAGLRNYDQAFAWLDHAIQENSWMVYIMDPVFSDLHRDPRFATLWASVGSALLR
jgi:TolB-like protein/tetratricopeptide (TPR) repeat protein